ncbi:hypothetical protein DXC26_05640 [Clostridiaceae bacterium OM08-6BH]|nr:hypothetical protein DXC26_05640 [Clostridiaceae bacterium OM08-6BH]
MMSAKKSIRAGLLIAAALVLLFVAFKSPGEAQKMEEADDIIVSQEDSFCAGDLVLKLSDAGGYPIYYTLDGSIPGFESGFYEDSLVFTATDEVRSCVLRARSYDESTGEWGDLFTRTYFYADSMETLKERFSTYIVCLTSDPYNLYDYEYGIMVEGKIRDEYVNSPEYISGKLTQPANFTQQGRDWERDAFVEILSPDGERLIAQDAGMRIFGHASRQYYYKSFKLYARKAYGNDTFAYPFFADNTHGADQKVQDAYKRLVVRAHGFDKSVTLFREELFQTLCSQIEGIDSKSVAPASVWLNGGYYNFEWLQEVYDDTYMEENYGLMQKGDYYQKVALRANKFPDDPDEKAEDIRGKEDYQKVAEYAEKNLTDDETFAELEQLVDIDNMIQYFAIETYIANWDWPLNNIKLYRYYSQNNVYGTGRQDGRWRYLYYDMEAGFNIYNEEPEDWLDIETVMEQNPLFGAVMKRPDMQEKFAKYIELCIKEYFTEDRVRAAVEKLCGERDSELAESFAYKHSIDESYTMNMDDVEQNKEVIYDFVEKRPEMMRQQIQELFGIEL